MAQGKTATLLVCYCHDIIAKPYLNLCFYPNNNNTNTRTATVRQTQLHVFWELLARESGLGPFWIQCHVCQKWRHVPRQVEKYPEEVFLFYFSCTVVSLSLKISNLCMFI